VIFVQFARLDLLIQEGAGLQQQLLEVSYTLPSFGFGIFLDQIRPMAGHHAEG
jgi:hypothetical protein